MENVKLVCFANAFKSSGVRGGEESPNITHMVVHNYQKTLCGRKGWLTDEGWHEDGPDCLRCASRWENMIEGVTPAALRDMEEAVLLKFEPEATIVRKFDTWMGSHTIELEVQTTKGWLEAGECLNEFTCEYLHLHPEIPALVVVTLACNPPEVPQELSYDI